MFTKQSWEQQKKYGKRDKKQAQWYERLVWNSRLLTMDKEKQVTYLSQQQRPTNK